MLNDPLLNMTLELYGLNCKDIDEYSLQPIDKKHGHWQLNVRLKAEYSPCPVCRQENPRIFGYYTSVVKVNLMEHITMEICVKRRRYRCRCCHKTWTENNPFVFKGQQISYGTVINILEELKNPEVTYKSLGKRFNVSPATIQNLIDTHLDLPEKRPLPEFLLIDEVYAFRDSESGYVCVLMDGDTGIPIDVLPSRRKEYLSRFLARYSPEERKKVKYFCSDMYQPYQDIAQLKFPWAIRAIDRFHVFQDFLRMTYVTTRNGKSYWKTRRLNSSLIENKNRVIQTLKRNANGFTNWDRFRSRILYVLDPDVTFTIPSNPREERNRNSGTQKDESQNELKK